jgi:uncharacterized protein
VAKEDRGFASMDRAKQREIASKGGKAAHQKGTAHEWTSEEARDAGRKGGIASHQRRREQSGSGSNVTPEIARERGSMDRGSSGSGWERSSGGSSSVESSSSSSSERDSYGSERGSSSEPSMPIEENE